MMSSLVKQKHGWLLLPDLIFDQIMLIIGLCNPAMLDVCKQVCKAWRKGILRTLWESPKKSWGAVIERRIEMSNLGSEDFPSDEKLAQIKLLGVYEKNTC